MLSDLNDYLLNDLSLIVIKFVKFTDKQLTMLMNLKAYHRAPRADLNLTGNQQSKLTNKHWFHQYCPPSKGRH